MPDNIAKRAEKYKPKGKVLLSTKGRICRKFDLQ